MAKTVVNNYGPSGPATVKVSPKIIEVTMDSDRWLEPSRFERSSYKGVVVPGHCFARISQDGQTLYGLRPFSGNYLVRFVEFAHKKDMPPLPRDVKERAGMKDGKPWKIEAHLEFTALCEITAGDWEDADLPIPLWYHFREDPITGHTDQILGRKKTKQLLDDFLMNVGVDMSVETVPWSENILPALEAKIKEVGGLKKEFLVNLNERGYVESITPAPDLKRKATKKKAKK